MDSQLIEIHKRNKLVVILLWVCVLLGIAANIKYRDSLIAIIAVGIPLGAMTSVLVWRRIGVPYMRYVYTAALIIVSFVFISVTTSVVNVLILFLGIGIISLYHDYRPMLLHGVLSAGLLNYFLFTKESYAEADPIGVNVFLILMLTVLITQSRIGNRMMNQVQTGKM